MDRRTAGLLLALAAALLGCGASPESRVEPKWWTTERLAVPVESRIFRAQDHSATAEVEAWDFTGNRPTWPRVGGTLDESWAGPGVRLLDRDGQIALDGDVAFDADRVDGLEIDVARQSLWAAVVYWSAPGEDFVAECSLRLSGADAAASTIGFPLSSHPCWHGRIGRLRFVLGVPEKRVRVLAVRAVRREFPAETLEVLDGTTWRVDVGGEVRDARLSAPGKVWEVALKLAPRARLALSYSPGMVGSEPIEFSASYIPEGGDEIAIVGDRVSPADLADGAGWRSILFEFPSQVARRGRLRLLVRRTGGEEPLQSVPVWGDLRLQAFEVRPGPDVALILIDTLRGDRISAAGYRLATSPRIDAWARRAGVVFTHAVAPTPWTLPSHVSLFTGLDAISHGVNVESRVPGDLVLLADRLRSHGYRTVAVTGGGYLHPRYGLERGFDSYRYWNRGQGSADELEDGLGKGLATLEAGTDEAIFLFFHTYEVHYPYTLREPYFSRFGGDKVPAAARALQVRREPLVAEEGFVTRNRFEPALGTATPGGEGASVAELLYDSGVAYADETIGRLLAALEERATDRPLLTVLTSDHGEALGERGLAFHAYLYEFNLHIPLIVAFPDRRGAGSMRPEPVGLVDVAPTILAAAGLRAPASDGVDLAGQQLPARRVLWSYAGASNWGVAARLDGRWKLMFNDTPWRPVSGATEFYDLQSDPREARDLGAGSASADRLLEAARERLDRDLPGLVIRVTNRSDSALSGEIRAPSFLAQRVKAPRGAAVSRVRWLEGGGVAFEVPPGEVLHLVVNTREIEALTLRLEDGRRTFQREVPVESIRRGLALKRGETEFREVAAGGVQEPDLVMIWRGGTAKAAPPVVDPALDEQLRALGYF